MRPFTVKFVVMKIYKKKSPFKRLNPSNDLLDNFTCLNVTGVYIGKKNSTSPICRKNIYLATKLKYILPTVICILRGCRRNGLFVDCGCLVE